MDGKEIVLGNGLIRRTFRLRTFVEHTGIDIIENDGSYPGDVCASTSHPGHKGLNDSQWRQWEAIRDFYQWCRGRGIYLNVRDSRPKAWP